MRKRLTAILAVFLLSLSLVACSNGGAATASPVASQAPAASASAAAPSEAAPSAAAVTCDKFTILNHRTDLAESGDFDKLYVTPFKAKYPGIKEVSVESIRDYHTDVRTRMNTTEYGDVLVIPNGVTASEYPNFFEPLGTVADLKTKYRFIEETGNFEGTVYGIAINGNGNGFLYNKAVFEQAGITDWPKSTGRVPRRPEGHQGQGPGRRSAVHELRGRLADVAVAAVHGRSPSADPDFTRQDGARRVPVGRGQGPVRRRQAPV